MSGSAAQLCRGDIARLSRTGRTGEAGEFRHSTWRSAILYPIRSASSNAWKMGLLWFEFANAHLQSYRVQPMRGRVSPRCARRL